MVLFGWLHLKTFHDIVLAATITLLCYHYARDYVTMSYVNYCACPIITVLSSQRRDRRHCALHIYISYKTTPSFLHFPLFTRRLQIECQSMYRVKSYKIKISLCSLYLIKLNYIHAKPTKKIKLKRIFLKTESSSSLYATRVYINSHDLVYHNFLLHRSANDPED